MSKADAVIAALRSGYDDLARRVEGLSDEELAGPTAADEWDVSQVLSHLGSGAEIFQNTLQAALDGKPNPGPELNKTIWARYDSASRRQRLEWFLAANEAATQMLESLSEETRDTLQIDMGFLPSPVHVEMAASYRLNELALHSWDVRAAFDPTATIASEALPHLLPVAMSMVEFLGKPDALEGKTAVVAVITANPVQELILNLGEKISISTGATEHPQQDGTLSLPAEAWLRLVAGRLKPPYIPVAVITTTGAADLDLLRRVFPKF
jgi:uncharacterized protein (TIGR03083 family)